MLLRFSAHWRPFCALPALLPVLICLLLSGGLRARAQTSVIVSQPTEAALDAALAQMGHGGTITFACDGVIPVTSTKIIAATSASGQISVSIDAAGHHITLDGGGKTRLLRAAGTATLIDIPLNPWFGVPITHQ